MHLMILIQEETNGNLSLRGLFLSHFVVLRSTFLFEPVAINISKRKRRNYAEENVVRPCFCYVEREFLFCTYGAQICVLAEMEPLEEGFCGHQRCGWEFGGYRAWGTYPVKTKAKTWKKSYYISFCIWESLLTVLRTLVVTHAKRIPPKKGFLRFRFFVSRHWLLHLTALVTFYRWNLNPWEKQETTKQEIKQVSYSHVQNKPEKNGF